jgi:hypothetical protein
MECHIFRERVESLLESGADAKRDDSLWQHAQICDKCRGGYAAILRHHTTEQAMPPRPKSHDPDPSDANDPDQLSDPLEFKDAPITFTLVLDGRKEAVKVVEPEMDVPLPDGGRLVVKEKDRVWSDARFVFNPDSKRPYELHFRVLSGVTYSADHLVTFGIPLADDRNLLNHYKMEIVARAGLTAWIEMTQGKARLHIKYGRTDSKRIPPLL